MEAAETHDPGAGLVARPRAPRSSLLGRLTLALFALVPGCTPYRLEINTAKQAQTVVDLEYRQILDNLAMFCLNPEALPSLVTLKTGASQVGDTGSAGFLGTSGLVSAGSSTGFFSSFASSPTITGTRTIVDQWGSSPVTDDNNLLLLEKAFRCALGWKDLLDEEDANDLAHDLNPQIGTTADISVDRDTLGTIFSQNMISGALGRFMPPDPVRRNPPQGTPEYDKLYVARRKELQVLADRLADVNELIDAGVTDTLDHEILAMTYAFRYSRRLDLELVKDVSEIATRDNYDRIWVAAVKGGLRLRIFDSDGKPAFDVQLMPSLRDGTEIPKTGKSLLVAAYFDKVPYFRIFDANGVVTDAVGTRETLSAAIENLRTGLDQPESSENLSASEKNRIIAAVISLADPCAPGKIKELQEIYDDSWSTEIVEWPVKREFIKKVVEITGLKSSLKERFEPFKWSSTGLTKETIYRLNDVQKTLDDIHSGWLHWGPEKPKHACYVGHARFCGKECYVWVSADGLGELSDFTRAVLKLGSTFKDVQVITAPTGIQFSPALSNSPR
jgi:hypothetical protein